MTIDILAFIQIIVSILLVIGILLQQRGSAIGSAFGQEGGAFYSSRRAMEKKIFWATCTLGALFVILAVLNLIF